MRYEFFKTVPRFSKILVFYQNSQNFCENLKIRYSGFNVCSVDVLSIKRVYMGKTNSIWLGHSSHTSWSCKLWAIWWDLNLSKLSLFFSKSLFVSKFSKFLWKFKNSQFWVSYFLMLSELNESMYLRHIGHSPIYCKHINIFNFNNMQKYENKNCKILNFQKKLWEFWYKKGFLKKREGFERFRSSSNCSNFAASWGIIGMSQPYRICLHI